LVNGGGGALCFAAFLEVKRMKTISIDTETYSDVNLAKCGVYKYAESPNFAILLFGYAVDGGPVQVIDLAQEETIPEEILEALTDDSITKWAFNANFERVCLSRYLTDLGRSLDPFHDQHPLSQDCARFLNPAGWKCSMVWSAYMGLPLSLEGVGAVLNLDNQKMKEGRDLIRYFCVPCKETKTNGGRTRNLPNHAPDKWNLFKSYNKRDVEVEMTIQERLQKYPVPDRVWEEYHQDQEINDRGIAIDLELARQAVAMDAKSRESLMAALKEKTRLENPNSVLQMLGWLEARGLKSDSLGKKQVKELLKTAQEPLRSVLQLRQKLAKSSVKKYQAMEMTACEDGRARGMYQFLWGEPYWTVCGTAHSNAKSSSEPSAGPFRSPGAGAAGKLRGSGTALRFCAGRAVSADPDSLCAQAGDEVCGLGLLGH
jgi:DNA polymerase bacteriophage-type